MPLPKSKKLLKLFSQIDDESIKEIIAQVISVENEFRYSSATNFSRRKIEDIIDDEANLIEKKRKEGGESK